MIWTWDTSQQSLLGWSLLDWSTSLYRWITAFNTFIFYFFSFLTGKALLFGISNTNTPQLASPEMCAWSPAVPAADSWLCCKAELKSHYLRWWYLSGGTHQQQWQVSILERCESTDRLIQRQQDWSLNINTTRTWSPRHSPLYTNIL